MASLLHRGMINGSSIVWKPVTEIQVGDSVVKCYRNKTAEVVKVISIDTTYTPTSSFYLVTVRYDNGTGVELSCLDMVRIPPQNPRVVYNDL